MCCPVAIKDCRLICSLIHRISTIMAKCSPFYVCSIRQSARVCILGRNKSQKSKPMPKVKEKEKFKEYGEENLIYTTAEYPALLRNTISKNAHDNCSIHDIMQSGTILLNRNSREIGLYQSQESSRLRHYSPPPINSRLEKTAKIRGNFYN